MESFAIVLSKKLIVEKISPRLCESGFCRGRRATYHVLTDNGNYDLCDNCLNRLSKRIKRPVETIHSEDFNVQLQNGKRNSDDKALFRSTSVLTPQVTSSGRFKDFGRKPGKKSKERDPETVLLESMAWEFGDKASLTIGIDSNMVLVQFGDNFYAYDQTGRIVYELDGSGHKIRTF